MDGVQLFSAFGKILLDDSGVESQLANITKTGESAGSKISDAFDKIKGTALKLGAALLGGIGLHEVYEEAVDTQKATAQMNAVLKSTKDASGMSKEGLNELAESQAKVTTYTANATKETENMLLTFTGIGKTVFPLATKTAEDMATAMGMTGKSAALQLGKALNDPEQGISKLTRVGVTFTDAQKDQIKAMEAAGNTAGAQKLMLQELQREFGGSAEAAGKTLPGQLTILKNSLIDMGSNILGKALPSIQNLISVINKNMPSIEEVITKVLKTVSPLVGGIITDVEKIVGSLFPSLGGTVEDAGDKVSSMAKGGLQAVKDVFDWLAKNSEAVRVGVAGIGAAFLAYKAVTGIISSINGAMKLAKEAQEAWGVATKAFTAIQTALDVVLNANPIGLVVIAIGAIIAALVLLYNNCKPFREWVNSAFAELKKAGSEVLDAIGTAISNLGKSFSNIGLGIKQDFNNVVGFFEGLPKKFESLCGSIGSGIKNGFDDAITFIKNLPGNMLKWGEDMINGFINGVKNMIGKVGDAVKGIADKIKSFLHFSVPDEGPLADADTYGPDFMDLISNGMTSKIDDVKTTAQKVAQSVSDGFNNNVSLQTSTVSTAKTDNQESSQTNSNGTNGNSTVYTFNIEKVVANDPNEFITKANQLALIS